MFTALKSLLFGTGPSAPAGTDGRAAPVEIFRHEHLIGEDFDLLIAANATISHLVMTAKLPRTEAMGQIIAELRRYEFIADGAGDSDVASQISEVRALLPRLADLREVHDEVVRQMAKGRSLRIVEVIDLVIGTRKRLARQASSPSLSSALPGTT